MNEPSLKGQRIRNVYRRFDQDNWALLQTDVAMFELRLGGILSTNETRSDEYAIDLPLIDKAIKSVKTDDYAVYFELENGACLIHSPTWVNGDADIDFEIKLVDKTDFDRERDEWYDSDTELKEIL